MRDREIMRETERDKERERETERNYVQRKILFKYMVLPNSKKVFYLNKFT